MDSIEYRGFWWLPDSPEETVAGFLTFSPQKGGKLELIGAFSSMFEGSSENYPIILGMTIDGKPITLQRCLETGRVATTSGTETTDYLVHFIFVGDHTESEDSLRFNKLQAKFTYLYDWVGVTGISREVLEKGQKYQVTYETPEDISIAVPDGKLDITFGANIKSGYDISNIKEKSSIFIEFAEDKTFYEFSKDYLFPLQALISLGTTKANYVEELYVFQKESPDNYLTVYYSQQFYQAKVKENLLPPDMLFTLGSMYDELEAKLNSWLAISQKIDSVLHLLNRIRIAPELFLEFKFLAIAQALETYHRERRENNFLPKAEHKKIVKEVVDNVPEHYKELVKQKMGNNEKSLLVRLEDLLQESAEIINPLVDDPEEFAKKARDSRNYYTHYGESRKKKAAKGAELHWLSQKLTTLLQSCLLGELGFTLEQQVALFRANDYYNRLTQK